MFDRRLETGIGLGSKQFVVAIALTAAVVAGPRIAGCSSGSERAVLETLPPSAGQSPTSSGPVSIGEQPAIASHLDQAGVETGQVAFAELLAHGERLFTAVFNALDGQGRPASTGTGSPRLPVQPAFVRTSGPDASSCVGCHNQPRIGGGGDFVSNVFVLAQEKDPVTFSVEAAQSNERNTLGMFGTGPLEMLAREMTVELRAIRDEALREAQSSRLPVTRPLLAKGVGFGQVTAMPDGRINPAGIEGVDWDLVVKPFHQKGAVVSIREFTNNALNHHHGMQSAERFGAGLDADLDGKADEVTTGDVTALTIFQAALPVPGRVLPANPQRRAAVDRGEALFGTVGCASCHLPTLTLDSPLFTEPSPFNEPGNLRLSEVRAPVSFDLASDGPGPRIERLPGSRALVRAYTDLKRHDLTDEDFTHFGNEQVAQGTLNGFLPAAVFTVPAAPRPKKQFLTRRLWDVGNSAPYGHRGDLTTLTAAISFHGGEARRIRDAYFLLAEDDRACVIEFLKSLQVLPEGSGREVVR